MTWLNVGVPDSIVAVAVLALLTLINCLGVRSGSNAQSALMVLKIGAIAALIVAGLWFAPRLSSHQRRIAATADALARHRRGDDGGHVLLRRMANVELRRRRNAQSGRDLARGLLLGVAGVVLLYTLVAFVCVQRSARSASPRPIHRRAT